MSKILVVEDNAPLATSMKGWLSKHYEVMLATNGQQAIAELTSHAYDLVLLDLGLPDMSGQEVCNQVRLKGISTPILVLTAVTQVSTKVNMLDMGADDYLLKPFYVSELHARIRALLRRSDATSKTGVLRVGDLTMDVNSRSVERAGQTIELRRKEFDILEYLMRNSGTVVSRAMIISNNWDDGADRWNNTVDVHIKYIRDKIDRPFSKKLIKTAYGVGYMIDTKS